MNHAFIGLGSNIDSPLDRLSEAYRHLTAQANLSVNGLSKVYVSSPQGPQDQPDFYNAVAGFRTSLPPHELLTKLLTIETTMGRQRLRHWGERCIDLDLLLYGDEVIVSELLGTDYVMPGQPSLGTLLSRCTQQTISVLCEFPQ